MKSCLPVTVCVWLAWIPCTLAQSTIDGRLAGDTSFYGPALSIQNTNTQFGNATTGDPINGGAASEIDQVFAKVSGGRLHVFVAGNLEPNFNKLEVFVDSVAGGVNTINGPGLPAGVDAFCCGGFGTSDGALQRMNGLTFDAGFKSDFYLSFMHGFENVNPGMPDELKFWAMTAHYADLRQGTNGAVVPAGMQLAQRGLPNVLRPPGDFAHTGEIDAAAYVVWRNTLNQSVPQGSGADANGDTFVTEADRDIWLANFGKGRGLGDYTFAPQYLPIGASEGLLGPALPGLSQGELIDRDYALGAGGCGSDAGGCLIRELEFALDVDLSEFDNVSSHRNFDNSIDLRMAIDNSNTAGVSGDAPYTTSTTGNPQDVTTGIEFSIPLAQIGNPTGNIQLTIFINGLLHDYASNQFSGAGILDANLGGNGFGGYTGDLSGVNLNDFFGNQFVTVTNPPAASSAESTLVPEPGGIVLGILFLVTAVCRRPSRSSFSIRFDRSVSAR
ncbi:MAG: hypothetical protein WD468_08665 [Pirellulales bacterium]